MTVPIGFYVCDAVTGAVLYGSNGQPLFTQPLPGKPDPYGYDSKATWLQRFNNGQALASVSYEPVGQRLQVVYLSGQIVVLPGIPSDVRTALLLATNPERYIQQLVSVVPALNA